MPITTTLLHPLKRSVGGLSSTMSQAFGKSLPKSLKPLSLARFLPFPRSSSENKTWLINLNALVIFDEPDEGTDDRGRVWKVSAQVGSIRLGNGGEGVFVPYFLGEAGEGFRLPTFAVSSLENSDLAERGLMGVIGVSMFEPSFTGESGGNLGNPDRVERSACFVDAFSGELDAATTT